MTYEYDNDASRRRIAAYTDFLMAAYGTDADGLADIAGISREDMAEYVATDDYRELNACVLSKLGRLTGISFSWLFAESTDGEGAA